ncbi:MAG: hypothetical protein ACXABG_01690 [Promethearchaeota archaeon]
MPYLVIRSVYPPHKIDELVKKLMEVTPKYPPDPSIGEQVLGAVKATEQGHISMTVFEVKEGQLDAAYARWTKGMAEYRNVEGFKYSIDVWSTGEEALATIGVTVPEQ